VIFAMGRLWSLNKVEIKGADAPGCACI
jgi:hypothetical protein